ncbi:hypothetical protein [Zobellella iuensis]|uniref:Flagellar protein FliT n=1 Tax=Zobellella iuensis TaxID=2803811 RepID=A0ABS1QVC6_9GAMM|nr:hypothetical protein [Zobellella iuensis]MBL1378406.1 hypothetical protein [Zobellella iuensis]
MSAAQALAELDERLFTELAKVDGVDEGYLEQQLALRAELLQQVINDGRLGSAESTALIARSRQLKDAAEQLRQQLADQLKILHKGRRSVQAYKDVKDS